ncbi:acyl-CoA dehydrogenase [Variovorax defluvii]|uniref:Acyl-CoA dehydrogenase n=1 Tax=Variovorax defluvii TaxID=913761 RepID=A0ABP8ICT1_9BURK
MQPELNDEQRLIRETVAGIARERFAAGAAQADRLREPPVHNLRMLAEHGFLGLSIPAEYGGAGLGLTEVVLVIEETARVCPNTAILLSCTDGATPRVIQHIGTEAQKRKYLPRFAKGELLAAWSMSEADAGSDLASLRTKAVPSSEGYVVNGSKMWCSAAQVADLFLVLVRVGDAPGLGGIGGILVERGTPGFTIGKHLDLIGLRGTGMAELVFEDCVVPRENLIVPAGGMKDLLAVFDADRIAGNPPIALGLATEALARSAQYLKERRQFGKLLGDFQGLQWKLADMAIQLEAGRSLLYQAARRVDAGTAHMMDASIAKTFINEMAIRVTDEAIQLHGAYGLSEEFGLERLYRDARGLAIGYGTTQIHRNMVAREVLNGTWFG